MLVTGLCLGDHFRMSTKSSMVKDFEDLMQKEFKGKLFQTVTMLGTIMIAINLGRDVNILEMMVSWQCRNKQLWLYALQEAEYVAEQLQVVVLSHYEGAFIIRAMVAGKRILISEETIRADLLFDDADGVDSSVEVFSSCSTSHVLAHTSTSWEQFRTNIASALVGLATNQKFNFSLMIMNGMLGHISNGTPFLMYPRFIQLFLNKQLEGVTRPQSFLPSVTLPSKVFTFMRKNSPKFSGRITPLTPPMLEVITALAAEEAHSTSPHSRAASSPRDAQGTPAQSAAQASIPQGTADSQGTAEIQGTADFQGTAETQGAADIPQSPNDYTPTDASQTSGGDEGLLDLYALNLGRDLKKRRKKQRKKQRKKVSSVKLGRNKDESNLSEENNDQDDHTAFVYEDFDATAFVTPDLERKNDETEERKKLDLEKIQSTVDERTVTPRTLNFDDETGPSSPIRSTQEEGPKEQFKDDELLADILLNRPRGLSIPGPMQSQPQQPIHGFWTPNRKRALEMHMNEGNARKLKKKGSAEEEQKGFRKKKDDVTRRDAKRLLGNEKKLQL
ncbi:hypothetical protein Tco_0534608 [Tanacetum coccineum]